MTTTKRVRYTLKFKQEALRLIEAGASQTSVAELVGVVPQTLEKWIYASRQGKLQTGDFKPMTPEQMEIALLRAELSRIKMQCAMWICMRVYSVCKTISRAGSKQGTSLPPCLPTQPCSRFSSRPSRLKPPTCTTASPFSSRMKPP